MTNFIVLLKIVRFFNLNDITLQDFFRIALHLLMMRAFTTFTINQLTTVRKLK